jgi:hypothetical protein
MGARSGRSRGNTEQVFCSRQFAWHQTFTLDRTSRPPRFGRPDEPVGIAPLRLTLDYEGLAIDDQLLYRKSARSAGDDGERGELAERGGLLAPVMAPGQTSSVRWPRRGAR